MVDFRIEGRELVTDKFKRIFEYEILDIKVVDNIYLVLLELPKGTNETDNIYGLNADGEIKWRVQNINDAKNFDTTVSIPYTLIAVFDNNVVKATNFMGIRYEIDYLTGELIKSDIVK